MDSKDIVQVSQQKSIKIWIFRVKDTNVYNL